MLSKFVEYFFLIVWTFVLHPGTVSLVSASCLSFSLVLSYFSCPHCVFIKAESYYALRVSAIDHRLGLSRGKGTMWCGVFLYMCVCWESSCVGVVGGFLRSLSLVQECMLGCPGLTLPVCVCACVCLQVVWVRALLLSLVLIKEAFELVSKTTSTVAGDDKCSQTGGY